MSKQKAKIESKRFHILLPLWLLTALKEDALTKSITTSDYIRDILKLHQGKVSKQK